ncbi:hypothetical protein Hypma_013885 [Hypsizygus marmoreus]|uniref:F-box domain-containing protein n=1 Tax=Hypsizygus marmoreus TaxID=39966 RepID=A0A369KE60_HYPMA|nr:hypothetical protein Hypma_013885 [Hypsizygus marmoreus]
MTLSTKPSQHLIPFSRHTMSPIHSLPLELIDIIIDHAHDNPPLLAACSLVCKAWFPTSRYHLFENATLNADNAYPFIKLLNSDSPTVIPYIRRIEAKDNREGTPWLSDLLPCLIALTSVTSISITSSFENNPLSTRILYTLHAFDTLVELKLSECEFNDFAEVQSLICAFPLLESLYLEADWPKPSAITPTQGCPSPHLRELYLRCEMSHVLEWFLMQPHVAPVSTLTLHGINTFELPVVSRYLETLGPALTHLTIYPAGSVYGNTDSLPNSVDLSYNTCLRSLSFVMDCDSAELIMANALLSQVESPCFSDVLLSFYTVRRNPKTDGPWTDLDAFFTRTASMKSVTVTAMSGTSLAKEALPRSHNCGILRVKHL